MEKDKKKSKILIFIPAYNVEKKIVNVLSKIPNDIFQKDHIHILIIEDNSKDETRQTIENHLKKIGDTFS